MGCVYCKNILVTSTIFQLSQLHVHCVHTHHEVQGMLLNKSSEDLEIKTLRSFSFNLIELLFFQNTNQLAFLETVWLHSYGRNASNVTTSEIGLLKEATKEEALG